MKIIQTFWTGTIEKNNPLDSKGGWLSPEYNWMSWALSCLQLKKIFGEVELFTDALGKEILIDMLRLPYSKVSVVLDGVLNGLPPEVWSLSKLHTYSLQEEPFLHFDGDLFLWQPIPDAVLGSEVIVQNKELDLALYRFTLDQINSQFTSIPYFCAAAFYHEKPIVSINAGIIGGHNLALFKQLREAAFEFICSNKDHLYKIKTDNLNFIIEQYFLACLADASQIPVTYVSENIVDSLLYGVYVNFCKVPEIGFIHPVSGHKKSIHVCDNLSKFLRLEYPVVYESILDITRRSGVALRNKVYITNDKLCPDQTVDFFTRTHAVIRHLAGSPSQTEWELALLSEICEVEKTKKTAYLNIFCNGHGLPGLCGEDAKDFERIRHALKLPAAELSRVTIVQNRGIAKIPVTKDWVCPDMDKVDDMVKDNFSKVDCLAEHMVFVPKITRMTLDEYIFDGLDGLLFNYCASERAIGDILSHAAAFFEKEDIEAHYDAFARLIIDSISRLCYLDVLRVKNKDNIL